METEVVISSLDPELLARLDVIISHLEAIDYWTSVVMVSALTALGTTVAVMVVVFLYRAIKQLF